MKFKFTYFVQQEVRAVHRHSLHHFNTVHYAPQLGTRHLTLLYLDVIFSGETEEHVSQPIAMNLFIDNKIKCIIF